LPGVWGKLLTATRRRSDDEVCARRLVDGAQRRVLDGLQPGVHEARRAMPIASRAPAVPV
jgi:hypothetical protein